MRSRRIVAVVSLLAAVAGCPSHGKRAVIPGAGDSTVPIQAADDGTVPIPGGEFTMGSDGPTANADERPTHRVRVDAFRLDSTEVTVADYGRCVRAGACTEPDAYQDKARDFHVFCTWKHPENRAMHPVNCVDASQARAYCAFVGKRLPTEEEWEYAARPDDHAFPWGDAPVDPTRANACGASCIESLRRNGFPAPQPLASTDDGWPETAEVARFPAGASPVGVFDLIGNVWEWTASPYRTYDGSRSEETVVLRGGSWGGGDPRTLRATQRFRLPAHSRGQFLGFRCAR